MIRLSLTSLLFFIALLQTLQSQPARQKNAAEIQLALNKLNVLGSALYIAAHPDDENTAALSWLANGKLVRAGYLALTRGDGGQNLLGTETGSLLGVLRTQELLAARRIDGAEQFFTRAIDFGYSKTPEETMKFWNHDQILSDVVWVIRKFRPDVILTRFSDEQGGHGHHLASAILAKEAFTAAADPMAFPEQLKFVKPWQAKRILWNTWIQDLENRDPARPPVISVDLGQYNPLLGKSYAELAAESRTMHKTQGFGSTPSRGSYLNYFEHTAGEPARSDLFDGVDLSWNRIDGGDRILSKVENIIQNYNPETPEKSALGLVDLYQILETCPENYWIERKKSEIIKLIGHCSGLWIEAIAAQYGVSPSDSLKISVKVINRAKIPIRLRQISLSSENRSPALNKSLEYNTPWDQDFFIQIPGAAEVSQPYWLKKEAGFGMYSVGDQKVIGAAQNEPALWAQFGLNIEGQDFDFSAPVEYRWNDATKGEQYRPLSIRPAVSVETDQPALIFSDEKPKKYVITIKTEKNGLAGLVRIQLPNGWKADPEQFEFNLPADQKSRSFETQIYPPRSENSGELIISAEVGGQKYNATIETIEYDHIPAQTVFIPATTRLVRLNLKKTDAAIGYIMGTGDEIPFALEQIGYRVELLNSEELASKDLSAYNAIICGVRAFNAIPGLQSSQAILIDYVKNGGTWIVQHNTRFGFRTDHIGPVPFDIGRDRISDETAELKPINPDDPLLHYPNPITPKDFENWVQERGLYFASDWDPQFQPVLTGNDPGEEPIKGSLIYAKYGKGVFIYTGLSFFRQLPAGVPGAYRLFVNLISAGKANEK